MSCDMGVWLQRMLVQDTFSARNDGLTLFIVGGQPSGAPSQSRETVVLCYAKRAGELEKRREKEKNSSLPPPLSLLPHSLQLYSSPCPSSSSTGSPRLVPSACQASWMSVPCAARPSPGTQVNQPFT